MALRKDDYWDQVYDKELRNFEDHGDEGYVWYGKGLSRRIANLILERIDRNKSDSQETHSIVNIGCGNAFLLYTIAILKAERCPHKQLQLLGIDYSTNSIKLSRKIIDSKNLLDNIELRECDFLNITKLKELTGNRKFNFIVDVGTYDAICLLASPIDSDSDIDLKKARTKYINSLASLLEDGTIFILASCNNTESELISLLDGEGNHNLIGVGRQFNVIDRLQTPQIQFGGKVGSQVCCLIIEFGC